MGELIYSYTRSASKGKGKDLAGPEPLNPDDEDTIVYEVYHVRDYSLFLMLNLILCPLLVHLEHSWVQRVPSKNANLYPPLHWSRVLYQRRGRFMGICRAVRLTLTFLLLVADLEIGMKSASDETRHIRRPIILLVILLSTTFTTFPRKFAWD